MSLPERLDYVNRGLDKLLHQFRDKSNIEALLTAYLKSLDVTQQDLFSLLENRNLEDATGVFLEYIGKLVGVKRAGATDEEYRSLIKIAVRINNSEGTPGEVLSIVKSYTGASNVHLFEHFPGNSHIASDGPGNTNLIYKVLRRVLPVACSEAVYMINNANGDPEPGDFGFRCSELAPTEFGLTDLTDQSSNQFQDNLGNDIQVTAALGKYTSDATLEELPAYGGGEGKPFAEIYDKNR